MVTSRCGENNSERVTYSIRKQKRGGLAVASQFLEIRLGIIPQSSLLSWQLLS